MAKGFLFFYCSWPAPMTEGKGVLTRIFPVEGSVGDSAVVSLPSGKVAIFRRDITSCVICDLSHLGGEGHHQPWASNDQRCALLVFPKRGLTWAAIRGPRRAILGYLDWSVGRSEGDKGHPIQDLFPLGTGRPPALLTPVSYPLSISSDA